MAEHDNQANLRGWARLAAVAPALLLVLAMGCLNPTLFDEAQIEVNHAPTVDDLTPLPSFNVILVEFGDNCRPLTFRATPDDADRDPLTVRWNLIVPRGAEPPFVEQRVLLEEKVLTPLQDPVAGLFYDFTPFELSEGRLLAALGGDFETQKDSPETQSLELRIADANFLPGSQDVPEGREQYEEHWTIDLADAPPGGCGAQ